MGNLTDYWPMFQLLSSLERELDKHLEGARYDGAHHLDRNEATPR